eukprot:gnl/Spiro4/16419_TR8823_c0_g1_i1.p1 gnl/Spiro4/16419_TR8823_c0_g1~~gnl/Spiro4/16419_TR8823_c0_g1_i1.p1  ORF type:complete len:560 (+),score=180.42 gnl/Spiro4/16419_TR8823_c0_g1_i1:70-1749(+)
MARCATSHSGNSLKQKIFEHLTTPQGQARIRVGSLVQQLGELRKVGSIGSNLTSSSLTRPSQLQDQLDAFSNDLDQLEQLISSQADATTLKPHENKVRIDTDVLDPTNRYARLVLLNGNGAVGQIEQLAELSVGIIGAGSLGCCVAEMLARSGVGKILLWDRGSVTNSQMNRPFFHPEHACLDRTATARHQLLSTCPDVNIRVRSGDVALDTALVADLRSGSLSQTAPVDLVIVCLRQQVHLPLINSACEDAGVRAWMWCRPDNDGMSGHILTFIPGDPEYAFKAHEYFTASDAAREVPPIASMCGTTMVLAGMVAQNAIKLMLQVGAVAYDLYYDGMSGECIDTKPRRAVPPPPDDGTAASSPPARQPLRYTPRSTSMHNVIIHRASTSPTNDASPPPHAHPASRAMPTPTPSVAPLSPSPSPSPLPTSPAVFMMKSNPAASRSRSMHFGDISALPKGPQRSSRDPTVIDVHLERGRYSVGASRSPSASPPPARSPSPPFGSSLLPVTPVSGGSVGFPTTPTAPLARIASTSSCVSSTVLARANSTLAASTLPPVHEL